MKDIDAERSERMIYTVTLNPSIDYIVHVDEFVEGGLNRAKKEYSNVGGKGIMVSKLLRNIGIENTALGFVGGFTGEYIKDWFKEQGLDEKFTQVSEDTRINVKLKSRTESEINGKGPNVTSKEQEDFLGKLREVSKGDTVIVSGSSAPGLDSDILSQIIDICRENEADFVVDTTGKQLMDAISKKPLVIKPNIHELGELFGREFASKEEVIPYGKKCLEMGAKYVIVSMGGDGALFFSGEDIYFAPRVDGKLVNSVGAGDSMLAGFVGSLKNGKTPEESFKVSVACGTGTAFCEDIATKESIEEIYGKTVIEKL